MLVAASSSISLSLGKASFNAEVSRSEQQSNKQWGSVLQQSMMILQFNNGLGGMQTRKEIAKLAEEHGRHLGFGTLHELGKKRSTPGQAFPSWEDFECLWQHVKLRVDGRARENLTVFTEQG